MCMQTRLLGVLSLALGAICTPAIAQDQTIDLFRTIAVAPGGTQPEPDTKQLFLSRLDVRGVANQPATIIVRIPLPGRELTARLSFESMDRSEGFAERDGARCFLTGDPEACEIIAIPNFPENEFSYSWSGLGEGYDLRLTVHRGNAVGILTGAMGRFAINWAQVKELRQEFFNIEDGPRNSGKVTSQALSPTQLAPVHPLTMLEAQSLTTDTIRPKTTSATTGLDMVVLFTEAARRQAGGNPADCSDTNGVQNYIRQGVRDVDLAFSRSQIDAQLGVVTVAKLNGFTLIPDDGFYSYVVANRTALNGNSNIRAFRDAVGADVVQVLVDTQTQLGPCGFAYVQASNCSNQGDPSLPSPCLGNAFADHALYLNTVQCSSSMDVFTHELGHILGADHDVAYANVLGYQSYPYAFGYYVSGLFETVMSQQLTPSLTRILQFSNPNVNYNGVATGNAANADNARAVGNLVPGTAAFRSRPEVIFTNGFDGIATCPAINF